MRVKPGRDTTERVQLDQRKKKSQHLWGRPGTRAAPNRGVDSSACCRRNGSALTVLHPRVEPLRCPVAQHVRRKVVHHRQRHRPQLPPPPRPLSPCCHCHLQRRVILRLLTQEGFACPLGGSKNGGRCQHRDEQRPFPPAMGIQSRGREALPVTTETKTAAQRGATGARPDAGRASRRTAPDGTVRGGCPRAGRRGGGGASG